MEIPTKSEELGLPYSLRAATQEDTSIAKTIHHKAYKDVIERQFGSFNEIEQDEYFLASWNLSHEIISVGERIVGYAATQKHSDHFFISSLVIDPDFQGQGIGSAYVSKIITEAKHSSLPVRLRVLNENRAKVLYVRLGFVTVTEQGARSMMEYAVEKGS
jgi:ribosomal protein S18 acetylase RimI-like enzyme